MNKKKIVVTPGDGIGPEVTEQALIIMKEVATRFQLELEVEECLWVELPMTRQVLRFPTKP